MFGGCGHSIDAPQPCRKLCVFARSFFARRCHVRLAGSGAAWADACSLNGCAAPGADCTAAVQPWVGTRHTGRCRVRRYTPYANGDCMQSAAFGKNSYSLWPPTRLANYWRNSAHEPLSPRRLTRWPLPSHKPNGTRCTAPLSSGATCGTFSGARSPPK